jgi:hypothetical protein
MSSVVPALRVVLAGISIMKVSDTKSKLQVPKNFVFDVYNKKLL